MEAQEDGWMRVTATVNDTWQLQWWLLGQGADVEVCKPEKLRTKIINSIKNALFNYTDSSQNQT